MPFSQGQIYFAIAFFVVFTAAIIYTYIIEQKKQKIYYKGAYKIILVIISFFLGALLLFRSLR